MYFMKSKYWSSIYDKNLLFKLRSAINIKFIQYFKHLLPQNNVKYFIKNFLQQGHLGGSFG